MTEKEVREYLRIYKETWNETYKRFYINIHPKGGIIKMVDIDGMEDTMNTLKIKSIQYLNEFNTFLKIPIIEFRIYKEEDKLIIIDKGRVKFEFEIYETSYTSKQMDLTIYGVNRKRPDKWIKYKEMNYKINKGESYSDFYYITDIILYDKGSILKKLTSINKNKKIHPDIKSFLSILYFLDKSVESLRVDDLIWIPSWKNSLFGKYYNHMFEIHNKITDNNNYLFMKTIIRKIKIRELEKL